jgi:AsmA protein
MPMKRALIRRVGIGAGVVIVVLVAALAIFAATFDVNRFKPQIVDAVRQQSGRTLVFDGNLSLSVFPRIAIRLPATTLSEPGRATVAARLQSGSATLALWPLLRKELVIDAVRVDGLQATLVRGKDGRTNFDDLIRPDTNKPAPAPADSAQAASTASIGRVELANADVTWRDVAAGRTVRVSALDVTIGRIAPSMRTPVDAHGALAVDAPAVNARFDAQGELQWDAAGGLVGVHAASAKLEGTWQQQPVKATASADRLVADKERLEVRSLKATVQSNAPAAPLEVALNAPRLEIASAKAAGERVEIALKRGGADALDAKAVIEGVRGNAARIEAASLRLAATARSGGRVTRLEATSPLVASLDARTLRIERAAGEAVIEDPALGGKPLRVPFSASAAIDGARQTAALRFDSRAESLKGRANVDIAGFAAPRIAFDVDAEQVDLDGLFGAPARPAQRPGANPPGNAPAPAAEQKIDWQALRALSANGKLRVARLRAHGIDAADVRAALKASDGRIEVAPIALRVHGGSVDGRVAIDARAGRAAANGSIAGIDLRRALGNVGGRAAIEGRANGTFDLAGAGATVAHFRRSLGGKLAVDVRDGALVGIDLADVIGSAAGLLQSRGRETGALDERKRTPFTQLSASAQIANGVASNEDLRARSPQLELTGRGRMDLVSTELDYALRAQVLPGPSTERTPLRTLAGITVPVRITGPIEQPAYAVDWTAVAADALLKRATGRAGAPAVNQVIEGLGELFGRRKK